ncbi:MAG: metallophosphoesterase [Chitinophagales bacterium]|nr:metallophosphoesterase [Chitinophagales bacterium]
MYYRIAHITDLHLDEAFPLEHGIHTRKRLDHVLEDIKAENITQLICTGDIGESEGISYFFELTKSFSLTITLGNHDSYTEISKYFDQKTIDQDILKLYSSTEQAYHKFIYLDSSEGVIDIQQLNWLKGALISQKPIVIFTHHPIIGLNLKVDDIGALKNRKEVLHLLENIPNETTIFCGHYHMESNLVHKNISQHITPATSFQIEKDLHEIKIDKYTYGYRIIDIKEGCITSIVKSWSDAN